MSKITKLLAMLLALVMVVSLFVGCKPAEQTTPTTTAKPQASTGANNQTTASTTTIENEMFPLAEPITFKMAARGDKDYQVLLEKCEWYKYLCEKTNVFLEVIALGSDAVGTLNTQIAGGKSPDVVLGPITLSSNQIMDLAAQDKLLALEELIVDADIMPNYQRLLEAVPQALRNATAPDGHIWSVPVIAGAKGTVIESPLTVNIEWLKQVPGYEDGKTFPKDVEAFTEVLRYFKAHDMNGNDDPNDEIPLLIVSTSTSGDTQATLQSLLQQWGISTKDSNNDYYIHIEDDGTIKLAPQTQNYKDALEWIKLWYSEGLLWENFFAKVSSADLAAVEQNETALWGFTTHSTWLANGPDADNGSIPWRDAQTMVEPFDTGYDPHYFLNPGIQGSLNCFTIFKSCKNPEVLLAWYDQFMSLEGTVTVYSGMSNEWERWDDAADYKAHYEKNPTWYVDEDGKLRYPHYEQKDYVDLSVTSKDLNDKKVANHPTWAQVFTLNAVFKGLTPEENINGQYSPGDYSEAVVLGNWIEAHPTLFDHEIWPRPYATSDEAEEIATLWPSVFRVIQDWEVQLIKGEKDLEKDWDAYMKEMDDAGAGDLVEILQGMWDRIQ